MNSRDKSSNDLNMEPRENLSSFMDGEVDKAAGSFLVRRLANDEVLKATWDRYHTIRDCLRQQDANLVNEDLCSRVRQAIEREEQHVPASKWHAAWLRPVAGVAVAASVALLAILNVGPGPQTGLNGSAQAPAVATEVESFVSPNIGNVLPASQPVSLSGQRTEERNKAKAYLLRHYQVTGDKAGQGFVALVPIVVSSENALTETNPEAVSSSEDAELPQQ